MNLRHLRTFVAIAEAGGVARAAAGLNMTQPTASRQVHALEAELEVPLFDRIGRRVRLTSQGEDLLRRSRRLLSEADMLGERARALKSGQIGVLRLGATTQWIESVLADFLPQYRRRHPGVEVRPLEDGGVRLLGRLERGDVHLTITTERDERFNSRLLYPVYLLAVLPKNHRLSRRTVLEVAELADEPLLLLGPGFGSREWFYSACQVAHIRPRVFFDSVAPHTLIALAADTGSQWFRRPYCSRAGGFVPCHWLIAGYRSGDGRRLPGIHNGSSLPTLSVSLRSSRLILSTTIQTATSPGVRHACPGARSGEPIA